MPCVVNLAWLSPEKRRRGTALVTSLILLAVLALLGSTAILTAITDTQIGANYKTAVQAFYVAEAGTAEARERLRASAGNNRIVDNYPTSPQWRAYIGSTAQAQAKGYEPGNSQHVRVDSLLLQDLLPHTSYTVEISHAVDNLGNVLYWGDHDNDGTLTRNPTTGGNIYVITSYGAASGANKIVRVEAAQFPAFNVPGALYVEAPTFVQGNTEIIGMDSCGNNHKPGIVTTLAESTVQQLGGPITIMGLPEDIQDNASATDITAFVEAFRPFAQFSYTGSNLVHTATSTPGPAEGWGQPTLGALPTDPSSCDVYNIVHYDTEGTMVQLSGGVSGCGILLVEGDLQISGTFSWYGLIVVTGSVAFTQGELEQKQIRGAVLAGGTLPNSIGLNSHIVYCSAAVNTQNLPLRVLSWREM